MPLEPVRQVPRAERRLRGPQGLVLVQRRLRQRGLVLVPLVPQEQRQVPLVRAPVPLVRRLRGLVLVPGGALELQHWAARMPVGW